MTTPSLPPAAEGSPAEGPAGDPVVLHVCTTCRAPDDAALRPGAELLAALEAALAARPIPNLTLAAAECLSVCKRPCTVALTAPGRWTYVYGDLDAQASAQAILEGVSLYAQTPDGIVPWRARPDIFRKGVVARIPPLASRKAAE